jgi:hypothetical protein
LPTLNGKKDNGDWKVKTRKIEIPNDNVSGFLALALTQNQTAREIAWLLCNGA